MRIKALNIKKNGRYVPAEQRKMEMMDEEQSRRQVSLMASEILPGLRKIDGLCTKKFYADIETEGLDYSGLSVGDILVFDSVCLEITLKGKRCFDECRLHNDPTVCPLPGHVAFARVIRDGWLKIHAAGTKTFKI